MTSSGRARSSTTAGSARSSFEKEQKRRPGQAARPLLGVVAYLGFDVLVLWSAFLAVHAHPLPGFPVVVMAYIIGALGGSLPLPAAVGTIGGIAGTLILRHAANQN